jgi:hypothetical protein
MSGLLNDDGESVVSINDVLAVFFLDAVKTAVKTFTLLMMHDPQTHHKYTRDMQCSIGM